MAIYKNTPPIVTNQLLFHLDAGNRISYTSGSATWKDLSGNSYNGNLSGSTFSSDNQGSIVFTTATAMSSSAFKTVSSGTNVNNNTTNEVWYKWDGVNRATLLSYVGDGAAAGYLGFYINNGANGSVAGNRISVIFGGQLLNALSTSGTLVSNVWTQLVITKDTTTTTLYQDGKFIGSTTTAQTAYTTTSPYVMSAGLSGNVAICKLYNRALTQQEVVQNYNAIKARFGKL
jgi:hypothetical protein